MIGAIPAEVAVVVTPSPPRGRRTGVACFLTTTRTRGTSESPPVPHAARELIRDRLERDDPSRESLGRAKGRETIRLVRSSADVTTR